MKILKSKLILSIFMLSFITGCIASVLEGGHIAIDEARRAEYRVAAEQGDKVAQYNLGNSYCCSTEKTGPIYNTTVAVQWLCASARKGYAPAMYKIGKIYSGDVIDGLRIIRRAATGITEAAKGNTMSLPVSYSWLRLANKHGESEAGKRMEKVRQAMSFSEIEMSDKLATKGLHIPCEMDQVFGAY